MMKKRKASKLSEAAESPPKQGAKRCKLSKSIEPAARPARSGPVYNWVKSQQSITYSKSDVSADEELQSWSQMVEDEPKEVARDTEVPLRNLLKDKKLVAAMKIAYYECEWGKCNYSTSSDMDYYDHVYWHGRHFVRRQEGTLECGWSLCTFKSSNSSILESHIHFHAYHTRLKAHGASLSNVLSVPACRHDSRARNRIGSYQIRFRCEWENCNDEFQLAAIFFHHVQNHITSQFPVGRKSSSRWLSCKWGDCKQKYVRESIAHEHARSHSTERMIGCPTCGAMFVARLKYLDHCKRQATFNDRSHQCPQCHKFYATKQILQDHLHMHERNVECPYCPMMLQSLNVLTEHIRHRHIALKPLQCAQCTYQAISVKALDDHMLAHIPQAIFRCEEFGCDASFRSEKTLKQHLNSVHYGIDAAMYACHLCSDQFKETRKLTSHLLKIHKLQRPPGHVRFLYKECSDGLHRLVVPELSTSNRKKLEPIAPDDDTVGSASGNKPANFVIDKIEQTNGHTVTISLKLSGPDNEPEVEPAKDVKTELPVLSAKDMLMPKDIDGFTVMKRYIKQEKPILITYEETDSVGSIVHSETYTTAEINLCGSVELVAEQPSC